MANKKAGFVEDVKFIFDECMRISKLDFRERERGLDNLWAHLPHPSGEGIMPCGKVAWDRVRGLAEEAGRRSRLTKRVAFQTLLRPTQDLLVERFITDGRPLSITEVDRLLSMVAARARKECKSTTHFVPCHLMHTKDPEEIQLGPVTFRNRRRFRQLLRPKIQTYPYKNRVDSDRFHRRLLAAAFHYYQNFNWIAEVTIDDCDDERSKQVATQAVTSALDCIHLLLGAYTTDRMRVRGPAITSDQRGHLTVNSDGILSASVSRRPVGQVGFHDGWSRGLKHEPYLSAAGLCAVALEAAVDPDRSRPLSARFLDAAHWFGEAARDDRASSKLVKYVTALERAVMTEEKNDISSHVARRVAALCFDPTAKGDMADWYRKAKEIYALRSKLVHGVISPLDPRVGAGLAIGAELGRATLLCALDAYSHELRNEAVTTRRLGAWFNQHVEAAEKVGYGNQAAE